MNAKQKATRNEIKKEHDDEVKKEVCNENDERKNKKREEDYLI